MDEKINMNFNPEQEVYELIYADDAYSFYGYSNHGHKALEYITVLRPLSLLDVGCGHNAFVEEIKNLGVEKAIGVDFACKSADKIADILNLPFDNKEFDFITAWDVLEHLLPEQIVPALLEMQRVSKRFAFTIAHYYARTPPPKKFSGHNLHQTVKEPEWWVEQIEKYAEVTVIDEIWLGKWK